MDQDLSRLLGAHAPQLIAEYANAGWRCFPVWPGKKNPMYEGWQSGATADLDLLTTYFRPEWERNVGVVCGERFDAWDIEHQHLPMFYAWARQNGASLPATPVAITGRGGIHILTEPTGVGGTRYLYLEGQHVGELKSTGGFILVSPSVTEGRYVWLRAPDRLSPQPAPSWLLSLLERPSGTVRRFPSRITNVEQGMTQLKALAVTVETRTEGFRNSWLYWAARRAIEEGVPVDTARRVLVAAAIKSGLDQHEASQTFESAEIAESAG